MRAYFSIGSNLEDREWNIEDALERIGETIGEVIRESSVYETEPWGFSTDDEFLNIAAEVETELSPLDLVDEVKKIESRMGRIKEGTTYESRNIDIDILIYGDIIVNEKNLKIPHPLMQERNFVLVPLNEIAPGLYHPVLKKTVNELLHACSDTGEVRMIAPPVHFPAK